jgi:hypothetical protein
MLTVFYRRRTNIVGIGCLTGKILRDMLFQNKFAKNTKYVGIKLEEDFYKYFVTD